MSSAAKDQPGRKKIVHHLDTPFTTSPWPIVSLEDQHVILELLCELLGPVVKHRNQFYKNSKGKRISRYIVRMGKKDEELRTRPAIFDQIDIGFNIINRKLQGLDLETNRRNLGKPPKLPYSMIFVSRGDQTSAFNSHYPQLVATAAKRCKADKDIRLVGFSQSASRKIAVRLGLARVSVIAFHTTASDAAALWDMVQSKVPPVSSPWLDEIRDLEYRPTNIKHVETPVGPKKTKTAPDVKK